MEKFVKFNTMITPSIIKILFWIGVAISVLGGIGMIIAGIVASYGGGVLVLSGFATLILGPLFTRIYCELLIVIFKIHENLQKIREVSENSEK